MRLEQEQAKAAKIPDPAVIEQERQLVAELQQKLVRQTELASALQQENATLKLRIADLKYPAVLPSNKASEQLEIAKMTISSLQATNIALRSEQMVLEARLAELSKSFVPKATVEKLQQEREDLRKQLALAQKSSGVSSGGMSADELERQLKIARARLEAFEAKAIPYTPEEQALFKQPDKKIEVASVKPAKKPSELPPGAGPLVFDAQRALDAGRFDEAEKKYQEVLRQDEKNTYTLVRLAAVQIEQNHMEDAEKNINKALSIDPEEPLCLYLKGYLCVQQNKYGLKEVALRVFNVFDVTSYRFLDHADMLAAVTEMGLEPVPQLGTVVLNHSAPRAASGGCTRAVTVTSRFGGGLTVCSATVTVGGCFGVGICSPYATSPATAAAARGTTQRGVRSSGAPPLSERPMNPPNTPPAMAAIKPTMAPSGKSEEGHAIVQNTCDQPHSAARPIVPMPTPAAAPNAIGRPSGNRRATASMTSASARYSGNFGVVWARITPTISAIPPRMMR